MGERPSVQSLQAVCAFEITGLFWPSSGGVSYCSAPLLHLVFEAVSLRDLIALLLPHSSKDRQQVLL